MAARHAAKAAPRRHVRLLLAAGVIVLAAGAVVAVTLVPGAISSPPAGAATHGPLQIASISPSGTTSQPDPTLRITFNQPLATSTSLPVIRPAITGSWVRLGPSSISFRAAAPWVSGREYLVVVPKSMRAADGTTLHAAAARRFTIEVGSMLRLNQLLAELNYLPLRFVPSGPFDAVSSAPQRGSFAWRWTTVPTQLTSLWQPDVFTVITKGAIMAFESAHNLPTDGAPSSAVWNALLAAIAKGQTDKATYNYVDVSTTLPETLTLYVNMKSIYTTLVNTGISSRPTTLATNPVYLRYITTTMTGTNPNGSHYSDPGIPWVSYFSGGEALHGFIRSSYGWPQSLGCVEMPFAHAKSVFPYTPIGTLVTVH